MDAIKLLKDDHKTVEALFRRFERAGDEAYETKREIVERIVEELSVHAAIEEQVFYPAVRAEVPSTESMTLEALEEHHIVKWTLSELDGMDPRAERFDAKVTVLIESVRHHVEEEEGDLFPKVRDRLSRERLDTMGKALREAKKIAPTRPHPRLPDAPPLNMLNGAVGIADRVSEKVMDTARSAIDFANPLSSSGRENITDVMDDAADTVRDVADEVTTQGAKAGRRAQRTVAKASRSVSSTAKKATKTAGRTASKAASTSKSTAKRASKTTAKSAKSTARSAKSTARSAKSTARSATSTAKSKARSATSTAKAASKRPSTAPRTAKRTAKKATTRVRATASR